MSTQDKIKNKAQSAKGKVKEVAGRASGNRSLEARGKGEQVVGKLKQTAAKAKDSLRSGKG